MSLYDEILKKREDLINLTVNGVDRDVKDLPLKDLEKESKVVQEFLRDLFPNYIIEPRAEGTAPGAVIKHNEERTFLKVESKISLQQRCITEMLYFAGIGPKIDYIDTIKATIVLSRDILKSKRDKRLIDETETIDKHELRKRANIVAFALNIRDIGKTARGTNNALAVYHQFENDLQLKVVDFLLNPDYSSRPQSEDAIKENLKQLVGLLKIKLGKTGPLQGSERKQIALEELASLEQVIQYGFKVGIEKFFKEKGVSLSSDTIDGLSSANINFYKDEIGGIKVKINTIEDEAYEKEKTLRTILSSTKLLKIRKDAEFASCVNLEKPIKNAQVFVESLNAEIDLELSIDEKQAVKEIIEQLNGIILQKQEYENQIKVKEEDIYNQINVLLPDTLPDDLMRELRDMFEYKETVLKPRIINPLHQLSQDELSEAQKAKLHPSSFIQNGLNDVVVQKKESYQKKQKYDKRKNEYEKILNQYAGDEYKQGIIKNKFMDTWLEDFEKHHIKHRDKKREKISDLYNLIDGEAPMTQLFSKSVSLGMVPENDRYLKSRAIDILNKVYNIRGN